MSHKLSVVFCWHMHQPFYKHSQSKQYALPWVYLHAIKEYTDMANILERVPGARAVVNFVPSLTIQIADYADRIQAWLDTQEPMPDPLLAALASKPGTLSKEQKEYTLQQCFKLQQQQNLHRYPAFSRLWNLAEHCREQASEHYLDESFYFDLLTWYHLAWIAESVREQHPVAVALYEKSSHFSFEDRLALIQLIAELLQALPERYKKLASDHKIELSTTAYAHPIIPLQIDFDSALETHPDANIPSHPYPDGRARAQEHLTLAKQCHRQTFASEPAGCWPAEGAISQATVALLDEAGFSWCASGEGVLHHSLGYNLRENGHATALNQPWKIHGSENICCFFRDDHLSDMIGFEYQHWDTVDAVNHFIQQLEEIGNHTASLSNPVVSMIMDGENAWEHYHHNGLPFLTLLYEKISEHPDFCLTTFSDYLAENVPTKPLAQLVAGSWVHGNLATWIGDAAKTRAWELLISAKQCYDQVMHEARLDPAQRAAANEQLRICEGSDWFWWFGDYNPAATVQDFDRLYRLHLHSLYELLGEQPPATLLKNISSGDGNAEGGGAMQRGH